MKITTEEILFTDLPVRSLSWKQPYASLMLEGKVETRTWATQYRGLVLICASAKPCTFNEVMGVSGYAQTQRIKETFQIKMDFKSPRLPVGQAIAIARLVDCRLMRREDVASTYVAFAPDLYVHKYEDVRLIMPMPWKGKLGWHTLTEAEKKLIKLL